MKKRIPDPTRPEGYYYGYDSGAECLAEYEAEARRQGSSAEGVAGYAVLWVFLAVIVALSILGGVFRW